MDAVVFDWDGTLVDTLGALFRANVAVLGAFGLPFDEALYRRHYSPDWREM
jgi:beta-phosphoglucomutase-like phosphatase (HAD superfamily)